MQSAPSPLVEAAVAAVLKAPTPHVVVPVRQIAANPLPTLPSPLPVPTLVVELVVSVVAAEVLRAPGVTPIVHTPTASPVAILGVDARVAGQYQGARRLTSPGLPPLLPAAAAAQVVASPQQKCLRTQRSADRGLRYATVRQQTPVEGCVGASPPVSPNPVPLGSPLLRTHRANTGYGA